ncbi:uncharacterized protein SPPG_00149 [Spizellomyces punctatus DAOM BR117]|uniref:Protein SYM1 n=1 Tax=Spizellomyces punctatus (strain DAOM BR117) TaxID=645134 RepID=A0A0L0HU27_SPIPD|nr:uncharacterized protein SPPG_00149 [Spizellomyces punctatus DAOM BR117]KND04420.1 hypothetical protein SPPG_00149 [Spizellomyces punctatus DAOM BR117]|eukprot:XP_016612459.1 hypothetical protein SPPG_00149 [Spizellomyces punctatus DAOM BR117]
MASILRWYHATLTRRPIATQAVTAGCLFTAGDFIAQHGVEGKSLANHDWKRTGRLATYGTLALGPAIAVWYRYLSTAVTIKNPLAATVARMSIDQCVFAPTNLFCFFTAIGFMEGRSWKQIKDKLRQTYMPTLKANFTVWPPVQLVNFYFTPVNYQSLVVNTVALGWNSYLSWTNAKQKST